MIAKKIIAYLLVPLSIFILFKEEIDIIISKVFVRNIFSFINPSKWIYDCITLFFCALFLFYFFDKKRKGGVIPLKWKLILLCEIVIYVGYRFFDNTFLFVDSKTLQSLKLLDFIHTSLLIVLASSIFKRKIQKQNLESFFETDEPTIIDDSNDFFYRNKFILNLAKALNCTNTKNASFAIGIVAPWGSGKTTFLNSLKGELIKTEFVTINLNLLKFNSSNQVFEDFLNLMKKELSRFSFSLNNKFKEYSNSLIKAYKKDIWSSVTDIIYPSESIEKQFVSINNELKRINKKIVVFIDDIDRLNRQEVYNLIRLIRDAGSFVNTYFIVAYDRNYIINAIEDVNSYNADLFLEKIFQLEFYLPPMSFDKLKQEKESKMRRVLTRKDFSAYKTLSNPAENLSGELDLTPNFVATMRDVTRFINSFLLSYFYVKEEVYFKDFYNLQLVKFKHPEIFAEFYRRSDAFIVATSRKNVYPLPPNKYALKKSSSVENDIKAKFELESFLETKRDNYKINLHSIKDIVLAFSRVFPQPETPHLNEDDDNINLSAVNPSMFDRYFRLGIEGRLSETEFSDARTSPIDQFKTKVKEWATNETLMYELTSRFKQIKVFDNIDDFQKVADVIVFFADLPYPETGFPFHRYNIGYESYAFAQLLGNRSVIQMFKQLNQEYFSYLKSILMVKETKFGYVHEFTEKLLHEEFYSVSHVLNARQISDILLYYLENAIANKANYTEVSLHYENCVERIETANSDHTFTITRNIQPKAKQIFRKFVLENKIDDFILTVLVKGRRDSKNIFLDTTSVISVFKSIEIFIWLIERSSKPTLYKQEFLEFYNFFNSKEEITKEGLPIDFFKVIPIKRKYNIEEIS